MRILKFGLVGVVNTVVGLGTYNLFVLVFGWQRVPAYALSWVFGFACSFVLNRAWTFSDRKHLPLRQTLPRFAVSTLVAFGAANLVVILTARLIPLASEGVARVVTANIPALLGTLASLVVNFTLSTAWAFAEPNERTS